MQAANSYLYSTHTKAYVNLVQKFIFIKQRWIGRVLTKLLKGAKLESQVSVRPLTILQKFCDKSISSFTCTSEQNCCTNKLYRHESSAIVIVWLTFCRSLIQNFPTELRINYAARLCQLAVGNSTSTSKI